MGKGRHSSRGPAGRSGGPSLRRPPVGALVWQGHPQLSSPNQLQACCYWRAELQCSRVQECNSQATRAFAARHRTVAVLSGTCCAPLRPYSPQPHMAHLMDRLASHRATSTSVPLVPPARKCGHAAPARAVAVPSAPGRQRRQPSTVCRASADASPSGDGGAASKHDEWAIDAGWQPPAPSSLLRRPAPLQAARQ